VPVPYHPTTRSASLFHQSSDGTGNPAGILGTAGRQSSPAVSKEMQAQHKAMTAGLDGSTGRELELQGFALQIEAS